MIGLNIHKRSLLLFVGIVISFHCFSQQDSSGVPIQIRDHTLIATPAPVEEVFYKGSLEAGGGVLFPITNRALRLSLSGVYDLHFSGNYVVAPHLFAGVELEDLELGNLGDNVPYGTVMCMYNVGLKFGYYTFMQQDFLFCYSLSIGPTLITYRSAPNPAPPGGYKQQSFFVTPNFFAGYRVNDELRIGFDFSVICSAYRFNAAYTGIDQYLPASYNPAKDNNGITTCIEFGFGFYWAFSEAKK